MSSSDQPQPSTSRIEVESSERVEFSTILTETNAENDKTESLDSSDIDMDKELVRTVAIQEQLLKSKTIMLEYEKHMFLDMVETDGIVVCAKLVIINQTAFGQ